MPKMNRQQVEEALRRGEHLAIGPVVYRADAVTLRPTPALPAGAAGGDRPDEFDAVLVRGEDGKLTRAGMEHAIRTGGAVMLSRGNTTVAVTNLDDLPSEVELARGDRQRLQSHRDALDTQMAALAEQRRQADEAMKRAESEAPKAEAQEPPTEPESQRRERERREVEERDRQRQAAESERQRQQAEAEQQAQRKKK